MGISARNIHVELDSIIVVIIILYQHMQTSWKVLLSG